VSKLTSILAIVSVASFVGIQFCHTHQINRLEVRVTTLERLPDNVITLSNELWWTVTNYYDK